MFSAKRGSAGMYRALTELRRANFARAALSLVHNTSRCYNNFVDHVTTLREIENACQ